MIERVLADEAALLEFAARVAWRVPAAQAMIHLHGNLGAGKTCFARGFLRGLGYAGAVKSPTYTLIEPHELADGRRLLHLDLYRIADPGELPYLGLEDQLAEAGWCLIEWPERGVGLLPPPDLVVHLAHDPGGRRLRLEPASARGEDWLDGWTG